MSFVHSLDDHIVHIWKKKQADTFEKGWTNLQTQSLSSSGKSTSEDWLSLVSDTQPMCKGPGRSSGNGALLWLTYVAFVFMCFLLMIVEFDVSSERGYDCDNISWYM